nr:uncharacterized protein LOC109772200 isoform X2 [Aegilops tauschii subsp. strangulata]
MDPVSDPSSSLPEQHRAHLNRRGRALSSSWRSPARASSAPSVVLRRRPTSCSSVAAPVQLGRGPHLRAVLLGHQCVAAGCPVHRRSLLAVRWHEARGRMCSAVLFALPRCSSPADVLTIQDQLHPSPHRRHAVQYVGARSTPHRRRAVQSVCASSTPPIPKPISLPPHTRSKRSLAHQAAGGLRRPRPDQRQGEVRIHQPRLPLPQVISLCCIRDGSAPVHHPWCRCCQCNLATDGFFSSSPASSTMSSCYRSLSSPTMQCGRAALAVRQGGACSAALTAEQRTQLPTRGNQGLIIHISSSDQDSKERAVAKINFLSLTDYVDPKQKTGRGAAALSSSNKSMYTLMNVVQALNSNHSFVPYRQSKVTRILQDSLCKTSGAVVIPSW